MTKLKLVVSSICITLLASIATISQGQEVLTNFNSETDTSQFYYMQVGKLGDKALVGSIVNDEHVLFTVDATGQLNTIHSQPIGNIEDINEQLKNQNWAFNQNSSIPRYREFLQVSIGQVANSTDAHTGFTVDSNFQVRAFNKSFGFDGFQTFGEGYLHIGGVVGRRTLWYINPLTEKNTQLIQNSKNRPKFITLNDSILYLIDNGTPKYFNNRSKEIKTLSKDGKVLTNCKGFANYNGGIGFTAKWGDWYYYFKVLPGTDSVDRYVLLPRYNGGNQTLFFDKNDSIRCMYKWALHLYTVKENNAGFEVVESDQIRGLDGFRKVNNEKVIVEYSPSYGSNYNDYFNVGLNQLDSTPWYIITSPLIRDNFNGDENIVFSKANDTLISTKGSKSTEVKYLRIESKSRVNIGKTYETDVFTCNLEKSWRPIECYVIVNDFAIETFKAANREVVSENAVRINDSILLYAAIHFSADPNAYRDDLRLFMAIVNINNRSSTQIFNQKQFKKGYKIGSNVKEHLTSHDTLGVFSIDPGHLITTDGSIENTFDLSGKLPPYNKDDFGRCVDYYNRDLRIRKNLNGVYIVSSPYLDRCAGYDTLISPEVFTLNSSDSLEKLFVMYPTQNTPYQYFELSTIDNSLFMAGGNQVTYIDSLNNYNYLNIDTAREYWAFFRSVNNEVIFYSLDSLFNDPMIIKYDKSKNSFDTLLRNYAMNIDIPFIKENNQHALPYSGGFLTSLTHDSSLSKFPPNNVSIFLFKNSTQQFHKLLDGFDFRTNQQKHITLQDDNYLFFEAFEYVRRRVHKKRLARVNLNTLYVDFVKGDSITLIGQVNKKNIVSYFSNGDFHLGLLDSTGSIKQLEISSKGKLPSTFDALDDVEIIGNYLIFPWCSNEYGCELFMTNGKGMAIIYSDIAEGKASSTPRDLELVNDKLVFSAFTRTTGRQLWSVNNNKLKADFSYTGKCTKEPTVFQSHYIPKWKKNLDFTWYIGADSFKGNSISHSFRKFNSHAITLVVTDSAGKELTRIEKKILISNPDSASINGPDFLSLNDIAWYKANFSANWIVQGGEILANHNDSIQVLWHSATGLVKAYKLFNSGCQNDTASLKVDIITSIVDEADKAESSLNIFPNPTTGTFWIEFDENTNKACWITIYDNIGREIQPKTLIEGANNLTTIKESGLYFVKVETIGSNKTVKVLVEN